MSNRKTTMFLKGFGMRKYIGVLLFLTVTGLLSGCSRQAPEVKDPTPSEIQKQENERSRIAVSPLGQPFEVKGCQVALHEVLVARPRYGQPIAVTLATADCPTAQATATRVDCGKNCTRNTLRIEPRAPVTPAIAPGIDRSPESDASLQAKMAKLDALELEMAEDSPALTRKWEQAQSPEHQREHQKALLRARLARLQQLEQDILNNR